MLLQVYIELICRLKHVRSLWDSACPLLLSSRAAQHLGQEGWLKYLPICAAAEGADADLP